MLSELEDTVLDGYYSPLLKSSVSQGKRDMGTCAHFLCFQCYFTTSLTNGAKFVFLLC